MPLVLMLLVPLLAWAPTGTAGPSAPLPSLRPGAQSRPAPRPSEQMVPFRAGETLTFDVSWSSYVTAGTATLSVLEKKPSYGSVAYYIVGEARPTPLVAKLYSLYYKADTLLDVFTLLPQRGSLFSQEGSRQRMKVTRFEQAGRRAQYEIRTATVVQKDLGLPAHAQDALSALYVLRALPLSPGERMTMPVCDNGRVYSVEITVAAREGVTTGLGRVTALRVPLVIRNEANVPVGRNLVLWLSDDDRRLPVRVRADLAVGSFDLTLSAVRQ